jgi:hypothetical protein
MFRGPPIYIYIYISLKFVHLNDFNSYGQPRLQAYNVARPPRIKIVNYINGRLD